MRLISQKTSFLSVAQIAVALCLSGLAASPGGRAQAQESATKDQQPVEEITVTGSRIVRTSGFSTPVPVTSVTAEELHTLKPGTTLTDQLGLLPQFYNTQSAQRGGGALFGTAGGSYLDLRSLGPQRTLILLDGARVAPADAPPVTTSTLRSSAVGKLSTLTEPLRSAGATRAPSSRISVRCGPSERRSR